MVADRVATAVLSRPDWYAGTIGLDVLALLRSARPPAQTAAGDEGGLDQLSAIVRSRPSRAYILS